MYPFVIHFQGIKYSTLFIVFAFLLTLLTSCSSSREYPAEPKIRIEGPGGSSVQYSRTYFDGKDKLYGTAMTVQIPESGVYLEDLEKGHQGLSLELRPSSYGVSVRFSGGESEVKKIDKEGEGTDTTFTITAILFDGTRELQRAVAHGEQESAEFQVGKINLF